MFPAAKTDCFTFLCQFIQIESNAQKIAFWLDLWFRNLLPSDATFEKTDIAQQLVRYGDEYGNFFLPWMRRGLFSPHLWYLSLETCPSGSTVNVMVRHMYLCRFLATWLYIENLLSFKRDHHQENTLQRIWKLNKIHYCFLTTGLMIHA